MQRVRQDVAWKVLFKNHKSSFQVIGAFAFIGLLTSISGGMIVPYLRGLASSSGEAMFNLGWFLAAPISTGLVVRYGSYFGYAYAFSITAMGYILTTVLFYLFFGKNHFKAVEESKHPVVTK
jgi:hypothetical protein